MPLEGLRLNILQLLGSFKMGQRSLKIAKIPVLIFGIFLLTRVDGKDVNLTGTIVNNTGTAVAGCQITLIRTPELTVKTAINGSFSLTGTASIPSINRQYLATPSKRSALFYKPSEDSRTGDNHLFDSRGRMMSEIFRNRPGKNPETALPLLKSAFVNDTLSIVCAEYPEKKVAVSQYSGNLGNLKVSKPNIIYILADDLGWTALNSYGNTFNETPNLNKMASQGMRFTNAYASAPVCSPTRGSLYTGQYPARVGILTFLSGTDTIHLDTTQITIAERLKDAGYKTGFIGKWHLTGYTSAGAEYVGPDQHGFDEVLSSETKYIGGGDYWYPYFWAPELPKLKTGPTPEYQVDRFNDQAVDYIARHKNETFFLVLSHMAVHTTLDGKPGLVAKYSAKSGSGGANNPEFSAMLESIDDGVGKIMDTLDALGLTENTLVIFNSDNGGYLGVGENTPLKKGKGWLFEGGIREPLIAKWPGIVAAGTVCDLPVITADMYPTLLEASKTPPAAKQIIDGASFFSQLKSPTYFAKERNIFWHYAIEKANFLGGPSAGAIRRGDWKLIQFFSDGHQELYNLRDDISETKDLLLTNPQKVEELKRLLTNWRTGINAKMFPGQGIP
jgi:arylsulfatase A